MLQESITIVIRKQIQMMLFSEHMQKTSQSEMSIPGRVLIVGAGLTGSLTATLLRRKFQNIDLTVWEKSRGAGGRMTTSRCPDNLKCTVDTGAQYISATPSYFKSHESFYQELLSSNVLAPFTGLIEGERKQDGVKHFIAPAGVSSIVKHFLSQSGANIHYQTHCSEVNLKDNPSQWEATDLKGNTALFDTIIITIPIPQLLNLKGSIQTHIRDFKESLEGVRYSSRYALGLFYPQGTQLPLPWTAKYVSGNPCIRFVSVDSRKRGQDDDNIGPSIVLHTSVPFGIEHLESEPKQVEELILKHAYELLPTLPKPASIKFQKWRYSQVSTPMPDEPGCLVLHSSPLAVASGDAFVHSNFDGCIESSLSVVEKFTNSKI